MASGQGNQAHGGVTAEKHRVDTVFARTGYAGHSRKNTRLSHGVGKSRHGHRPRVEPKGARGLRTPAEVAQFRSSPQKKGHIVDIGGVMTWQVSLNQANQFSMLTFRPQGGDDAHLLVEAETRIRSAALIRLTRKN